MKTESIDEKAGKDLMKAIEKAVKPLRDLISNAMKAFEDLSTDLSNLNNYKIITGCQSDVFYRRDWKMCEDLSKAHDDPFIDHSPQKIFETLLELYKFGIPFGDEIEGFLKFLIETNRI